MNVTKKQPTRTLQYKTVIAVIAVHILSLFVIFSVFNTLPRDDRIDALDGTIIELKKSIAMEDTITGSVVQLSRLAQKSGYELAVGDIIKDHRSAMSSIKTNLAVLQQAGNETSRHNIMVYVIIVLGVQGLLLVLYFSRVTGAVSLTVNVISRQIDDILAGKEVTYEDNEEIVEFTEFYDKFKIFLNTRAADSAKKLTKIKKKNT